MGTYITGNLYPRMEGTAYIPDVDHCAVTEDMMAATAGEALNLMDLVVLQSDGKYDQCDADVEAESKGLAGMVLTSNAGTLADADIFVIVFSGIIRDDTWNWATPGKKLYISATPGQITDVRPATGYGRCVGHVLTADAIKLEIDATVTVV